MKKKLNEFIDRKSKILTNFSHVSNLMYNGIYTFDNSLSYICHENDKEKALAIFGKKNSRVLYSIVGYVLRRIIFKKKVGIENISDYYFKGTIYLPANNREQKKDAKIFNFEKLQVLSIFSDNEKYIHKIDNYKYFSNYFLLPKHVKKDKNNLYIIEELINFLPNSKWTQTKINFVVDSLFLSYENYLIKCGKEGLYLHTSSQEMIKKIENTDKNIIEFFKKNITEDFKDIKLPLVRLHGDLWRGNILFKSSEEIYIIDWEHSDNFFILYDIFWFFQNEAVYSNNYFYIKKYFSGGFDISLEKVFNAYNMQYIKYYRKDYFFTFLANVFETRFRNSDRKRKYEFYTQVRNLVNEIID